MHKHYTHKGKKGKRIWYEHYHTKDGNMFVENPSVNPWVRLIIMILLGSLLIAMFISTTFLTGQNP